MNKIINKASILWFLLGFVGTYLFGSKQKNHEGRFVSNLVVVGNTSACNNQCYHIHHWMWMLVIVVSFVIIHKFILKKHKKDKKSMEWTNLFALYLGASISEYIKYGTDIFQIKQKCFADCRLKRYK
jgi:hypothetical protein